MRLEKAFPTLAGWNWPIEKWVMAPIVGLFWFGLFIGIARDFIKPAVFAVMGQ